MQQLHALYHHEIPSFLQAAADTPAMQRLKDIGMSCGCQYTAFPLFDPIYAYSRFDHSLGTALILWHFTQDEKQALAGLFHDIAAPVFSHTVDFVYGDKDTQGFTEGRTRQIIQDSPEIQAVLTDLDLTTDDVCDYHIYPLADNESPRLSADRLEYTFGNLLHYQLSRLGVLKFYYNQINIQMNEKNEPEFVFQSPDYASVFSHLAIQTSRVYICEECRYTMEFLSRLLKTAIQKQVLTEDDLWTTESQVIGKLKEDPETNLLFTQLCDLSDLTITDKPLNSSSIQTTSKRRFIDPLVPGYGRVSEFDAKYASQIYELQHINFDVWMTPNFLQRRKPMYIKPVTPFPVAADQIVYVVFDQNGNALTMPSSQQTKKAMDDCQAFMKTNADQQVQDNVIWTRFTCHNIVSHHNLSLYVCATLDKKEIRVTEAAIILRTLAAAYTSYMEQMVQHV